MNKWRIKFGIKIFFGILFFGSLLGFIVMVLWNCLLPEILSLPKINFWQAIGLLALTRILFGTIKGWKGCNSCCNSNEHNSGWKKKWEDRLANMTPEEREKAKEKYKRWCGFTSRDEQAQH